MRIRTLGRMAMGLSLLVASTALLVAATTIEGQVTAVDTQTGMLTVQTSTNNVVHLQANAQSTYTSAGQPLTLADVRIGDRVSVEQIDEAGTLTAKSVTVMAGSPSDASSELPRTASWLPLVALLGTMSLGAALVLRMRSRTSARIDVPRGL